MFYMKFVAKPAVWQDDGCVKILIYKITIKYGGSILDVRLN